MMPNTATPRIHLGPNPDTALMRGIERGGGVLAPLDDAEAVVWAQGPDTFPAQLPDSVRWVQLPSAGVEPWISAGIVDTERTWTSAAGAYAGNVAEHGVLLLLAGVRALTEQVRATSWRKAEFDPQVGTLRGATVAIVGCGGIGRAMIPLLDAFGARVLAVTRSGTPVPGAVETLPSDRTSEVWSRADHFVIAAPATAATAQIVDKDALAQMKSTAWIVNVARGSLVDTAGLVDALRAGSIGGAALDVTDPEPLPGGHPLWTLPNAIITPHVANPATGLTRLLADHVASNVERFAAGAPLMAPIDPGRGY
ncbi:D-isomer specific 2-hydroxyacid dehydrogenase family protein [Rhodococcus sp. ACPA1]|uniref:D-isomer specific 2-hydroxyacid dehydrogenase family protein n=1 Tax=Rhodococcus sp. ACPA1 TaxID=2028572 RepID=UPI000BB0EF4F|nr:D-isomer specific 2-hydroxyacid dehydrogenase family protein [Rhodococcus sp. ACPA1]PBC55951.1 hydroxyacid dehydrogenase [Rhodococcus sp. ACPA1]RZK70955.1 MAG: hydroxyacid dehydrogenase [Rhodococcus sp. (in: high G+C Gram-positive bacteria)]